VAVVASWIVVVLVVVLGTEGINGSEIQGNDNGKEVCGCCSCIGGIFSFLVDWFNNLPQGIGIGGDGKIDGVQIVNEKFAKPSLIAVYSEEDNSANLQYLNQSSSKWDKGIIARVTVKKNNNTEELYTVYCKNANSIGCFGLFNDSQATKIEILSCGNNITDMRYMFHNCSSLTSLDLKNFNTNKVTDMSYMFSKCSSLTSLNLSKLNTNEVTDMSYMFAYCKSLTSLNLSNFVTKNVTYMGGMFNNCSSLTSLNLSKFKTNKVTDMRCMFAECVKLEKLTLGKNFTVGKGDNQNSGCYFEMFTRCFIEGAILICSINVIRNLKIIDNAHIDIKYKCGLSIPDSIDELKLDDKLHQFSFDKDRNICLKP